MTVRQQLSYTLLLFLSALTFQAEALPTDNQQPATMSANSGIYNRNTGVGVYIGDVAIKQGTTTVNADKVITYNDKTHTVNKAVAIGINAPAHFQTLPQQGQQILDAYAKEIDYYPQQKLAVLIGNAKVTQGKNVLNSPKIFYDMQKDQVTTTSSPNQRTTMVVQPNQLQSVTKK